MLLEQLRRAMDSGECHNRILCMQHCGTVLQTAAPTNQSPDTGTAECGKTMSYTADDMNSQS